MWGVLKFGNNHNKIRIFLFYLSFCIDICFSDVGNLLVVEIDHVLYGVVGYLRYATVLSKV